MDYKLWEDAGFGINGQQQPVQKNRGFFDALGDFASGTWANTSSMMDSTDLHKLREELLHPVAGTTPEEYEALKQQYRDLYNEQQQTRLAGQQAQDRLKQDGRMGEFAAYATNVGGSLPSIGLNLVGHATGSFPITNVLGSYMDAESAAIEASEKVLSEGGTLEQAEMAFKNALPKQIATTIPDTVVDQMIWGGMGKKLGLSKGAIDSAKRFASKLKDPATRIGSEVAFKTGKRFLGKGAGLVADSLMNVGSENIQEGSQNYVSDIEAARAMGQDVDYSLGGFKDSLLSKEGIETAKGTTAATLLTSLIGGSIKSGQYLSRGAETNVGIKTHNAFNGMQNEKGIKLNPQARAEEEMTLSKLKGFSLEELASWSDADIVAESAVARGDMRKNLTGEENDISQIREAVDTVARLSKDQNSITKEGQITEETRDILTRMGFDEKDINEWFASPTDVLAKARQVEQEEQAKQKQAEQKEEKPKTTIKVSPETGETLNVKQGEVVQGQKPTEQTTDTQEPVTEKTTQNSLGEQAKQAEQQGTIQQDEEIEYPDSIIGWERDHDADNRDGVEYDSATYYSLKDNSISARIEPSGNGFTVIKVDEQGNATSDSKNKNFPSLKAAIDYLQQNKGETVFQKSDETQAEMPSDGVDATKGNSGTLVGSVEDLYNLSQKEPDLINPYEFAEFVRIKQHMGAGDLDVYIDKEHTGQFLGEDGQWHRVNAKADRPETAKGRAIIQLYKGGDLGSAIHEIAHTAYWKLNDADKRTFGYYAIKTQGKYIADSLDEDYTPEFENRLLKLASKVSQNVELDEQDKQLQQKILDKAATNQIYDNLITFYNSKMNGGAVDLKNLTPQQQRAIEERWAWEMSQWYIEGYSVGVAPSNIIERIKQRGCESIAKDLNSLARIWQHIHHKNNNEIENIYRGGQAEQQQEQAEQTPNINVQFTNELERQAMPNVNMPMNFGGEQAIQYGVPTLGESYNDAQEYANLYNELERRYANRQKMQGLPSADGSIPTVQNRPTQTEEKKTTTGYKERTTSAAKNKREAEKLVKIIEGRKSGWEKALEKLAYVDPKRFRSVKIQNGNDLWNEQEEQKQKQQQENINNLSNTKFSNPEMEARPLPQTNFTTPTLNAQPMNESVTRTNGINTGRPMYFNPINKQTLNEMNTTQQPKQEQAKEKPKPKKTTEQKPTKQEVKQETKQEQPNEQTKPTIPTDEIYSHLYFGDKTGKLKYNPKTKKIEYFVEEAGGRDPITLRKTYKLVNKGEITPEQYNELRQRYEQDFRKAKGEKKENAPDLVEGMKKEDFMYSAYKETKRTEKEKEETTKELGKENQGLVTGKSEEYARQNTAEEAFNNAMKGESLSGMEETELTKEQKKEAESSVEQELPKVEKKKTEKQTKTKETKKTTSKQKTTDYLSALHKKYKSVTGTPIGEKGYRFTNDEKAFIEGFKGMIDGAIGNKEELVNVAKRLDSWFQNDPTERNRMVRKYLSSYLADAAKINTQQNDTIVRHQLSDKAQKAQDTLNKAFPNTRFQFAWHGTSYDFNEFSLKHLLSGEGAMAHGWGLYFAAHQYIGLDYARKLGNSTLEYSGKVSKKYQQIIKDLSHFIYLRKEHEHISTEKAIESAIKEFKQNIRFYENSIDKGQALDIQYSKRQLAKYKKYVDFLENNKDGFVFKSEGKLIQVEIPDNNVLIRDGESFSKQPEVVKRGILKLLKKFKYENKSDSIWDYTIERFLKEDQQLDFANLLRYIDVVYTKEDNKTNVVSPETGEILYKLDGNIDKDEVLARELNKVGIKGISYLGFTDGECFVIFDDNAIDIVSKFKVEEGKYKSEKVDNARNREIDKQKAQRKLEKHRAKQNNARYQLHSEEGMEKADTNSPAFKNWFEGSILKNKDGSPKVMYRGIDQHYNPEFDKEEGGIVWITDDIEHAKSYRDSYLDTEPTFSTADRKKYEQTGIKEYTGKPSMQRLFVEEGSREQDGDLLEAYANIKNPFNMGIVNDKKSPHDTYVDISKQLKKDVQNGIITEQQMRQVLEDLSYLNKKDKNGNYSTRAVEVTTHFAKNKFWGAFKNVGYDSVKGTENGINNTEGKNVYGVFDKGNVKSIYNNGTFDKNNKDVRYQLASEKGRPLANINTQKFKNWFGNSTAINTDGTPKVFYRGQGHQYDPNYKFDKTDSNRNKLTWVAQTKEFVKRGAYNGTDGKGDLWEVYIRTENPFNMGQIDYLEGAEKNPKQLYEHVIKKLEREVKYRRITKKQLEETKEKLSYLREGKRSDGVVQEEGSAIYYFLDKDTKLVGALKDLGYDSILGIEDGTNTFALFSPNQVKSIYNNGDFDNNNNDIRYQKADSNGLFIKSNDSMFGLNTKLSNEQVEKIQDDLLSFIEDSPSITKDTLRKLNNIYKDEIRRYNKLYTISDNVADKEVATLNINNNKSKLQIIDKLLNTMKDDDIIVNENKPSNVIDITSRIKNRDSRFQKSEEGEEKKLTKKQEKKLEIQKEIKEAKEKGQTTDTYKDVYSVSFTKSAQESKVNQEKMKYFDERKSAWERHEENGRVTYTRTTPFEHHQKVITYNGINDKIVEQKPKKKYREWMDFIKEKISKNLFNDQYALYKLATDLGLGNAYMRMVVTQGYAQKTGVALEKGIMYNGKRTRAMNDIAREIGEEKQSAFCEYAIAKHLQDIYNRPNNKIEQKYDKDEVDAVIKRVEASKDYELFERCRKDLVEYNHACFHILVDGGIITEQEFQKYVERDKNYVPLSKVMDKEDFGFNSIQFARSMVNVGSPVRKLGTSKREIKNIFGEMQKRTAIYHAAAARNKAGQIFVNEICDTLDKMYDGDTVSRGASIIRKVKVKEENGKLITRPDTDKQIFYVNNGGKHEFYQVSDPEIYRALRHLDEEQLHIINGMLEKMLSAPAGLVRATATATPDFGIRNIIRDNLTAFYTSEHGFIPIIDALWGMREIKRNGEFYQRYIDQVGEYGLKGRGELLKNNTYKLKDYRESLKDEVLKEFNILTDSKHSIKDRTKALLRMTIGAPFFAFGEQLERFNMYLEQGTRVGEFKNAKMGYNGLIDRITSDLSVDINKARQSDIVAAYKAQDVTLYFSQHGLLGGKFNRFVPFLNASLLGAQKFVNAVDLAVTGKDSMNQKNTRLRKELLFKVALSTAFAIGLSAAGHGDEDYDEAPDYEKDTFWIFPNGIRIPKDEVFGRSIGTAVQRAFDQYYKEGKVDVLKTFESIAGMFKPNTVLPTVLDMFYGSIYNKDSFTGREIVPEYMTHKVGYQQKDIYTGNLAADLTEVLYKAFGINLSAKRVDWALQKNLTNAKKYLDAVYDVKEKLTDPEHFNEKMARGYDKNDSTGSFVGGLRDDVPPVLNLVTGTFATNRSQYQSVSDFQKKYQEIKQIADNDKDIPMTREQKRKWQRYEKAYKEYTKLRKQLKAIRSNASLSGTDKREKAEPIFKKQIKLAQWAEG